ncbi:MAG: hypothetical protein ABIR11_02630 [Candidatus Limnocylindrales bacterium]
MRTLLASSAVLAALFIAALVPAAVGARSTKILEFESMVGVTRPLGGATGAIRGINGAGLPWVIGAAKGELSTDGQLEVRFSGLVFDPSDQGVIDRGLAGTNSQASMRVVVSCVTGAGAIQNLFTDAFPVTTGLDAGNGKVETHLSLPAPCVAPIVLITNSAGTGWFAAMGR